MDDIFDQIEKDLKREKDNEQLVMLLKKYPWDESPLPMDNRLQRIAHWFFVDGKSLPEISAQEKVTRERVRQLRDKAVTIIRSMNTAAIGQMYDISEEADEAEDDFDYDVRDVMIEPDDERIDVMRRLLHSPLEDFHLSVRAFNCLRGAKMLKLGDVLAVESPNEFLKYRNFGKRSLVEIEQLLFSLGFKWRDVPPPPPHIFKEVSDLHRLIILNSNYPLKNFVWSDTLLAAFAENGIETIEHLRQAKKLLYKANLPETDKQLLRNRMREWGIKWED
jgi:hypothetical protein